MEAEMKQHTLVTEQFGNTANAYATSAVHAQGEDLKKLRELAARHAHPRILDLGCGAGHASFAVAPVAAAVTAYDLSEQMLAVVEQGAQERGLSNITTTPGAAEQLPFPDGSFDVIVTRFSAHHWLDVPAALKEVHRVLAKSGCVLIIDIVSSESPLHDTMLQAVEVLRDASHVRDYRISEWIEMLSNTGFMSTCLNQWQLVMVFQDWVKRMRTPLEKVTAIQRLFDSAPQEVRQYFELQTDYSFAIDAAIFEARKNISA
jgi:ubiquinone/menaquinone biosynthesis C-methylase UbiE